MKRIFIVLFLMIGLTSCKQDPNTLIPYINGNWEIQQVQKNKNLLKEYNISTSIDYFQVNEDLTGFRKKLMPNLNGKYIMTEHEAPFILLIEEDDLFIQYQLPSDTIVEKIKKASESELIIENDQGFTYFYKPFEPFNFEKE